MSPESGSKVMLENDVLLETESPSTGDIEDDSVPNSDSRSVTEGTLTCSGEDEGFEAIKNDLTQKETRQVFRLRVLVICILIAAAIAISVTIFHLTQEAEMEEFEMQYYGNANKVVGALETILVKMAAVSGLAVAATAYTQDNQLEWPFVTLSNFDTRAGNARALSGANFVSINPIVPAQDLTLWEIYVNSDSNAWINESLAVQETQGLNSFVDSSAVETTFLTTSKVDPLHSFDTGGRPMLSKASGPFLPRWQTSPVLRKNLVNENLFEDLNLESGARDCIANKAAVLSGFIFSPPGSTSHPDLTTAVFATLQSMEEGKQVEYEGDPVSNLFIPIFDNLGGGNRNVVAVLQSTIFWRTYLRKILPRTNRAIRVIVDNFCDGSFTFELRGEDAFVVGMGELYDPAFSEFEVNGKFLTEILDDGTASGLPLNQKGCPYSFRVYPTEAERDAYLTNTPLTISLSVASVFAFTLALFMAYDWLVEGRQRLVLDKATQSTAIVTSLFPKQVHERLLASAADQRRGSDLMAPRFKVKTFLDGNNAKFTTEKETIADLFSNCTVLFCDIADFTAWSSTREPAQVFVLLQAVYQSFDVIAKRRRVFKVETIGDSYLAVTGLPEPQSQHALIMAKFAWDCLITLGEVLKDLEVSLGPDTGELSMRFGMHSGSVTAGVLKGDRARFQLFGDTVNTAARMESTGEKGRIQVSETTADILIESGKVAWLSPRDDVVNAKGKGVIKTFWLDLSTGWKNRSGHQVDSSSELLDQSTSESQSDRFQLQKECRLVGWVTDILLSHVKKVVCVHQRCIHSKSSTNSCSSASELRYIPEGGKICLDEVQNEIKMPEFNPEVADAALDSNSIEVPSEVASHLTQYVAKIAKAYRDNPFHNFEHACHVTMSVSKLLTRVITPELDKPKGKFNSRKKDRQLFAAEIHNLTHGLTSDPIASLAIVFSALIHDVDHQGISNVQLSKEDPVLAGHYRHKSVAEQNSLDIAWNILMLDEFASLRNYIFQTKEELLRFRQLIVNLVLATDIFDKELGQLRKDRWQKAFHDGLPDSVTKDMRATIVMEHIIQASDVSHTMQHWHVYQKWNRKLFHELFRAYKAGRMGVDPRDFWYKGEISFFDNYVVPLAKKLKDCNVFGVSSDEYLGYALRNRDEWVARGEEIVRELIDEVDETSRSSATDCLTVSVREG